MTAAERSSALRHYLPEPGRWWICHVSRTWPGARGLWTHLGDRTLGVPRPGEVPAIDPGPDSDLVYLPPVEPELASARDALAHRLAEAGVPVLMQWRPGVGRGYDGEVLDPLEVLLGQGVAGLDGLETDCRVAVWPLIAGLTDDPEDWRSGIDRLAAAGITSVVPCALELAPRERRRLAELSDETGYQALFHGSRPDERALARLVSRAGLEVLPPRPAIAGSPRRVFCRLAGTELAQTAELWLRLGRSEAAGEDLLRAARWVERSARDLRALVREGNLEVLPWLDSRSRGVVEDLVAERTPRLRTELAVEYLGGE